jgi:hypothetical protein
VPAGIYSTVSHSDVALSFLVGTGLDQLTRSRRAPPSKAWPACMSGSGNVGSQYSTTCWRCCSGLRKPQVRQSHVSFLSAADMHDTVHLPFWLGAVNGMWVCDNNGDRAAPATTGRSVGWPAGCWVLPGIKASRTLEKRPLPG